MSKNKLEPFLAATAIGTELREHNHNHPHNTRKVMLPLRAFCFILLLMISGNLSAQTDVSRINVKTLGAVGDGANDDTSAIQKAIDTAADFGGEIFIPAGKYRITKTLLMSKHTAQSVMVHGQGGSPMGGARDVRTKKATTLIWDGEVGGTLLRTEGAVGSSWRDMNFDGGGKAGILFLAATLPSWGNMLNSMSHVHFFNGDVGIQMAEAAGEHNDSDFLFEFITFRDLKIGFLVKNDQGVDFLFNYVFGLLCGKVFDFERGGNLVVNNAQLTECQLFLDIQGGGRNAGTFIANNVRIESSSAGKDTRFQLLRSSPSWKQASVKFVGYDDSQWNWKANQTESRNIPLMEIGPGTVVTVESSIFNGPAAGLSGTEEAPACLIMRECSFGFIDPVKSVTANEYGHFKLLNNLTDTMKPLPDVIKWPHSETIVLPDSSSHAAPATE